jgi:aspartate aminotransferase
LASEAGVKAIRDGKTHYPPNHGILDLRAAAARHLSLLSGGRAINADHVVVSSGARQSIFNACFALFGPGDRVLIPAPAWVSYPQLVHFARATPVLVPGAPEWSLKVGPDELQQAYDARVTGLILCSPVNPTGAVYTRAELQGLLEWAAERKLWVISDEMYRRIHFGGGPAPSVHDLPDDLLERTVVVTGVGKAYAMTGWRVGIAIAPPAVSKAMSAFQSHITAGASQAGQWASAAAFADERLEADVARMVDAFRKRRDRVVAHFRAHLPGVEFVEPMGAFYFFFRVDSFGSPQPMIGRAFCERLLAEGVALVPGEAFGDARWARLSFAASDEALSQGLERITRLVQKLQNEETA